jgi:hypothetical protein
MKMRMADLARAAALCFGMAALATPAIAAPIAEGLPDLDPLDPASCDHEKGYVVIALSWVDAWYKATKAGQLEEPRSTNLATWFIQMENYLLESNDVKGSCVALVQVRLEHKF